jgi:hypothetical protein
MTEEEKQKAALGMTIETESPPDKIQTDVSEESRTGEKCLIICLCVVFHRSTKSYQCLFSYCVFHRKDYSGLVPELLKFTDKNKGKSIDS